MTTTTPYVFRGITLPGNLRESIDRYVNERVPTGGFLRACINDSLRDAVVRADEDSLVAIPAIVGYLYNECPAFCWGRAGAWEEWIGDQRSRS